MKEVRGGAAPAEVLQVFAEVQAVSQRDAPGRALSSMSCRTAGLATSFNSANRTSYMSDDAGGETDFFATTINYDQIFSKHQFSDQLRSTTINYFHPRRKNRKKMSRKPPEAPDNSSGLDNLKLSERAKTALRDAIFSVGCKAHPSLPGYAV